MKLASLGSGSKGNATLVASQSSCLLIDNGFSLRELRARAARHGFDLARLDAVLVTHEHGDHCAGVSALARQFDIPVFLTHGTARSGRFADCPNLSCFNADSKFQIGDISVSAIAVPHDAREPVQYLLQAAGSSVGVLTDLGSITPHVVAAFSNCDLLLLEFNHDREMLRLGPYPPALKRRVGGDWGHLSNEQAVALLSSLDWQRLHHVVVAHVSEQNNRREAVEAALRRELPELLPRLVWAEQDRGFPWLSLVEAGKIASL